MNEKDKAINDLAEQPELEILVTVVWKDRNGNTCDRLFWETSEAIELLENIQKEFDDQQNYNLKLMNLKIKTNGIESGFPFQSMIADK